MDLALKLRLISDTTFGRGDGVAGLVDQEVEHDSTTGLPFVRGRTLKGLLVEECANILFAIRTEPGYPGFTKAAQRLFGSPGSTMADAGALHVGSARMPEEVRKAVEDDIAGNAIKPTDVLALFTDIRRQTAVDEETGAPDRNSLRSSRVLLRETVLMVSLNVNLPEDDHYVWALLVACIAGLRRGGSGRNRGRGRLEAMLTNIDTEVWLSRFEQLCKEVN